MSQRMNKRICEGRTFVCNLTRLRNQMKLTYREHTNLIEISVTFNDNLLLKQLFAGEQRLVVKRSPSALNPFILIHLNGTE